ncbi:MAG: DNA alkylation repair protein [Actinobacteria bacterium]|nr:DNA alkylation repair protein [Actinomycetota bacterium]MCB9411686.1 DNA alkylation repair protein [Actinomycetota bacterium]
MWQQEMVVRLRQAYEAAADPDRAEAMSAYLKGVAPFLGIGAGDRRRMMRQVWRELPTPTAQEAVAGAADLRALEFREYHYVGAETLGRWHRKLDPALLNTEIRAALLHVPWWDSVDLLGSAVINPMTAEHPETLDVMWEWNSAADQWLIRASIQHQRGRKAPDLDLLFALCEPHTADRRFFVAKAIGWALRDATRIDVGAVEDFVAAHPELPPVAAREARRGIARETAVDV